MIRKTHYWARHLNKLRWISLSVVFIILIIIPCLSVYQTYIAAHAYDLLMPGEKSFYNVMEFLTKPFTNNPEKDLDVIKGSTWSGNFFGYKISDPLAIAGQVAAGTSIYWPFIWTAIIPIFLSVILGRFFCGWICPATFLYELNSNLRAWLDHVGLPVGKQHFDRRLKYLVLIIGLVLSILTGSVLIAAVYPPAIIGREIYYAIALGGFGVGAVFFAFTLLFDLLVARRGFCRYLCPGGALYSLLGRYRLLRIQRDVKTCNDCIKCTAICEFELDPMRDDFGQECNNCTACIAICPTDALKLSIRTKDKSYQGAGHMGKKYKGFDQKTSEQLTLKKEKAA